MTDEMMGIIKTMSHMKRSDSVDKLKRARTLEEKLSEDLRKSLGKSLQKSQRNKSTDSRMKPHPEKGMLSKIMEFEEKQETHSIELKEANDEIK